MTETTSYVKFLYPGVLFCETSIKEIAECDPYKVDVPASCFAFSFFDIVSAEVNGITLKSEPVNVSKTYYPAGRIFSLDEVKKFFPNERILILNMENNNYKNVILCRTGNFTEFNYKDAVLLYCE